MKIYLALASFEQWHKDSLVELPGSVFIGISEGGAAGGGNSKMFQFTFTASETSCNFSERVSSAQLAEEHSYKLAPASESSGMSFGLLKLDTRKQC